MRCTAQRTGFSVPPTASFPRDKYGAVSVAINHHLDPPSSFLEERQRTHSLRCMCKGAEHDDVDMKFTATSEEVPSDDNDEEDVSDAEARGDMEAELALTGDVDSDYDKTYSLLQENESGKPTKTKPKTKKKSKPKSKKKRKPKSKKKKKKPVKKSKPKKKTKKQCFCVYPNGHKPKQTKTKSMLLHKSMLEPATKHTGKTYTYSTCRRLIVPKKGKPYCAEYTRRCIKWKDKTYRKCLKFGGLISCWRYVGCTGNMRCMYWSNRCLYVTGKGLTERCVLFGASRPVEPKKLARWAKEYNADCTGKRVHLQKEKAKAKERRATQKKYRESRCLRWYNGLCAEYERECLQWHGTLQFTRCKWFGAKVECWKWQGCGATRQCIEYNYKCSMWYGSGVLKRCVRFSVKRKVDAKILKWWRDAHTVWAQGGNGVCDGGHVAFEHASLLRFRRSGAKMLVRAGGGDDR